MSDICPEYNPEQNQPQHFTEAAAQSNRDECRQDWRYRFCGLEN